MRLTNDLYTIYGELLMKKDREITPAAVRKIRRMGEGHKQPRVALRNTDIFTDFQTVFSDQRYKIMLAPPVSKKEICAVAGSLKFENDLVTELAVMKMKLPYTYNHVLRVAAFAIKLSLTYKPKEFDRESIAHCGFTHDLGKTRISPRILNKKDPLTQEERSILETHPTVGYLLLNYYLKQDRIDCSLASLEHHERPDGSGYPNGIRKIRKYARLISPVDVMDALMTQRPYRKKVFSLRATLDYLLKEADAKRFEKGVVWSLISYARKAKPDIRSMKIARQRREELPEELFYEKYK